MNPGPRIYAGAAALAFAASLVLLFPARVAQHAFAPDGVELSGVSGTVWSGTAQEMSAGGLYFRDVAWQLRPLRLLTGKLALDVEAKAAAGLVESRVQVGFSGAVTLTDLHAEMRLQALQLQFRMPGLSGIARADFERLAFRDGVPAAAEGTVTVTDLVAPKIYRGNIGGYRSVFTTTDEGIVTSIEDAGGVIDVAATLSVYADRRFEFLGTVAATERTPVEMRERLQFLGLPDAQGRYELRTEGRL